MDKEELYKMILEYKNLRDEIAAKNQYRIELKNKIANLTNYEEFNHKNISSYFKIVKGRVVYKNIPEIQSLNLDQYRGNPTFNLYIKFEFTDEILDDEE